jgi:serine/threonine protein kinase
VLCVSGGSSIALADWRIVYVDTGPIPASLLAERDDVQAQLADTGLFTTDQLGNGVLTTRLQLPPLEQAVHTKDAEFLSFLRALLQIDPALRLSAHEALAHPWLQEGVFAENRL